jgi:hypothetical protein
MIQHGDLRGDRDRMAVGHVDGAGAELDAPGGIDQGADEHHAGGDVLRPVGGVLAHIAFHIAELVRQDEGLAILAQALPPLLVEGMDRHGEESELHLGLRLSCAKARHQPAFTG